MHVHVTTQSSTEGNTSNKYIHMITLGRYKTRITDHGSRITDHGLQLIYLNHVTGYSIIEIINRLVNRIKHSINI